MHASTGGQLALARGGRPRALSHARSLAHAQTHTRTSRPHAHGCADRWGSPTCPLGLTAAVPTPQQQHAEKAGRRVPSQAGRGALVLGDRHLLARKRRLIDFTGTFPVWRKTRFFREGPRAETSQGATFKPHVGGIHPDPASRLVFIPQTLHVSQPTV